MACFINQTKVDFKHCPSQSLFKIKLGIGIMGRTVTREYDYGGSRKVVLLASRSLLELWMDNEIYDFFNFF